MLFFLFHPFLFSFRVRFKRNELKNLVIVRAVSDIWGFAPSSFPAFFLSFFPFFLIRSVFILLYISLFLQKSMPFHSGRIVFSCFPDCLHFNPVRIFSSLSPPFFLPASTLFLPGTPFFRFFPPAFPLPFPCAYI